MPSASHLHIAPRGRPSLLSVVVPLYNEQEVFPLLQQALGNVMKSIPDSVEVVLVDDGSSDLTLRYLLDWAALDSRVKVISLARNFGHQLAATAGLDYARGEAVVLMDADLQDPPDVIGRMVEQYCAGYDVVYAQRTARRGEAWSKRFTAWLFYRIMRRLVYKDLPPDTGDFRLVSRRCLDALNNMRETARFLRGMVAWVGFPHTFVSFERPARAAGKTKYSWPKMFKLAWTASMAFSPAPLRLTFLMGFLASLVGVLVAIYALWAVIFGLFVAPGWASLMVVICFLGSAILISVGLVGEYVAKIFEEVKDRPLYVVQEAVNFTELGDANAYPERHRDRSLDAAKSAQAR